MDATRPEDFEGVRERLLAAWGRLDLVVFNAGTYQPLRAAELTPAVVRGILDTNLLGVMDGVAACVPLFTRQGRGAMALVGSVAGYGGLLGRTLQTTRRPDALKVAATFLTYGRRGLGALAHRRDELLLVELLALARGADESVAGAPCVLGTT